VFEAVANPDAHSIEGEAGEYSPRRVPRSLLRAIGIDVRHLHSSRSALPYLVAALAMCFYLPYGTWAISHALGLANGGSGQITLVMVIGGLGVTAVIIGFDALIISYVPVNLNDLEDSQAPLIGKLSRTMIALRLVIAVVMVGVFTIPTLLFFFQRETTADLASQNQQTVAAYIAHGPPAQVQAQINKLTNEETSDPNAVLALENRASALDQASASDYQLALQDSEGKGLTHLTGCPVGGDCWALQQKSQQEASEAKGLRQQAQSLQASQKAQLSNDASEVTTLTQKRNSDIQAFTDAQSNNTGLGARTKSLVSLAFHDPFGIGLAAAIILAVATLLELAVLGIKVTASRNSEYELSIARDARRAMKSETELDSTADGIAAAAIATLRTDPGLLQGVIQSRRRRLEQMLQSRVGTEQPRTLAVPFDIETSEQPNTPVNGSRSVPVAPSTTPVVRLDMGPPEQPDALVSSARMDPVQPLTTSEDGPHTETIDHPSAPGDRPDVRRIGQRSSLDLPPLLTSQVPKMSSSGQIAVLAVLGGFALVMAIWGLA
jgi:hypothetical protein